MKLKICPGFILAGLQLSVFRMPGCQALKEERFRYTLVVSVFSMSIWVVACSTLCLPGPRHGNRPFRSLPA